MRRDQLGDRGRLHPRGMIRLRHVLTVHRRVDGRGCERDHGDVLALQLLGERHGEGRDRRLRRRIGRHTGALPRIERGARGDVDDVAASPALAHVRDGRTAAQHARGEVHRHLLLEHLQRRVGDRRPGKATGDVHHALERRQFRIKRLDRGLVGQIDLRRHRNAARREAASRHLGLDGGDVAMGARLDKGMHHGTAQCTGAASHHDVAVLQARHVPSPR